MTFMCQKDSYLKEFLTKVKSSRPACDDFVVDGKKTKVQGYEIILEDSILFPEGGGQPDDRGTVNDIPVLKISRVGAEAVHFISSDISAGTEVYLKLDWNRRFDHMQQHTAQHLITAITDKKYGYQTTSWSLGTDIVTIELETTSLTLDQMLDIEKSANENIRENISVRPTFYSDKNDPELKKFRGLGLPADHVGSVRVLSIEGIDDALCCGTHVSNLSHIQAIKLLCAEKGKKNKINLSFLAGGRLLKYVGDSFTRERTLTGILKGPSDKHCDLAEKAVKGLKNMQKACNLQLRELATMEVALYKQSPNRENIFVKHRKDGDNDYISVLISELGDNTLPKLITVGDDKDGGMFVLAGSEILVKEMGSRLCDIFEGKGAANKETFRGKATKLANRIKAEKLLREYLGLNQEKES
ncbi:alanyl-tRNA editing protein Aarsd1-B-like [Biomphalaria glabrata]|uniref:Alanyl-tRNA editing protein Aarsd1-B-like n=1 Tax=Biomphalaria glabrata TaxID=6526 RepID=A0A9W2YCB1_BIOGL|nr:alanyl-tRNA editing protein Aarsd1-B-like [Biomphalaria glabrata]